MFWWILQEDGVISRSISCPVLDDEHDYKVIFPRVFDGADTQLKKLTLINAALQSKDKTGNYSISSLDPDTYTCVSV